MPRQTLEILPRRFNPFQPAKCFDLRRRKDKVSLRFVDGVIAQLVERLNGIQEVRSSSLLGSTISNGFHPISPCRLCLWQNRRGRRTFPTRAGGQALAFGNERQRAELHAVADVRVVKNWAANADG